MTANRLSRPSAGRKTRFGMTFGSFLIIAILLSGMLSSCQTPGAARIGQDVPTANQIMLKSGGPHTGVFTSRDMTINYSTTVKNNTLNVSGTMDIRLRDVDKLSMTIFFIDENGTVFDYDAFFARPQLAVQGRVMDNTFSREFELPDGTAAISFGYTGRTRASSSRGPIVFRYSPF